MALIVTPGADNADSYASLAEFQAYCASIGVTLTVNDAAQEVLLRKGTRYLDRAYRSKWYGFRTDRDQALSWPRTGDASLPVNYLTPSFTVGIVDEDGYEVPSNVIPQRVKDATCEAALIYMGGGDPMSALERGGMIAAKTVSAGPVSTSTTYASGASAYTRYRTIEGLLRGYAKSQPGGMSSGRIVRG